PAGSFEISLDLPTSGPGNGAFFFARDRERTPSAKSKHPLPTPWPGLTRPSRARHATSRAAGTSLRLELGIPVEIVEPAVVQVVGREQPSVAVQLEHRRPVRHLERPHARVPRHRAALLEVA